MTEEQRTERAQVEARRGIHRDTEGRISFTNEELAQRIAHLLTKRSDFANRLANIDAEVARCRGLLAKAGLDVPAAPPQESRAFVFTGTPTIGIEPPIQGPSPEPVLAKTPGWRDRLRNLING